MDSPRKADIQEDSEVRGYCGQLKKNVVFTPDNGAHANGRHRGATGALVAWKPGLGLARRFDRALPGRHEGTRLPLIVFILRTDSFNTPCVEVKEVHTQTTGVWKCNPASPCPHGDGRKMGAREHHPRARRRNAVFKHPFRRIAAQAGQAKPLPIPDDNRISVGPRRGIIPPAVKTSLPSSPHEAGCPITARTAATRSHTHRNRKVSDHAAR